MQITRVVLALLCTLLVCSRQAVAAGGVYGIGFSPYVSGQDPNLGSVVTIEQIRQRLAIAAPHTTWIRSFGMTHGLENIPQVAREFGLKVAATAWISADTAQNSLEVNNLIAKANAGLVDIAIVGSEVIRRGDLSESALLAYMNQVRQAIPAGIPVTTADTYAVLLGHPNLIAASGVVFANFYPYWEGTAVNNAMCALQKQYQQVVGAAGVKPVVVSETGWPSAGDAVGAAVPSVMNASTFARQFFTWAGANGIPSFYFEAFDEAWKGQYSEGPQGAHWGIWDESGSIKPGMDAFFNGATETVACNALIPGPVALSFVYVPPYGSSDQLEAQVTGVHPQDYNVATYIFVNGGWWTKPTLAQPVVAINPDGTVRIPIATGPGDEFATQIKAFLIPAGVVPPAANGGALPAVPGAVAMTEVTRTASSISGFLFDRQNHPIAGAVVTDPVLGSARSAPDGKYSFFSITSGGSAVLTVSHPNYVFTDSPATVGIIAGNQEVNFRGSAIVDLSIAFSSSSMSGVAGANMTGTFIVANGGPATGSDGLVGFSVPDSFQVVSVTTSRGVCPSPDFCRVGELAPGAFAVITFVLRPSNAGSFTLSAHVASPDLEGDLSNNDASATVLVVQHARTADFDGDGKRDLAVWRPSTGDWWVRRSTDSAAQGTQWGAPADVPMAGDYDGDGRTDLAVWRPSTGDWWVRRSSDGAVQSTQWGALGDVPVAGDYDGDGRTDLAVWRPSTGVWWVRRSSDGAVQGTQWGAPGDMPMAGDYDGDGRTDIAVWRPSTGDWWVRRSSDGAVQGTQWGAPGDVPMAGDYDGDGRTDIAVWRPSTGDWWVRRSSDGAVQGTQWGVPGDVPMAGDYDGDGRTDIALWRPSTGDWRVLRSSDGAVQVTQWGAPTDVPMAGDYDGDGRTDIAVWRPSTGDWWVRRSSDGAVRSTQWGALGDVPVAGDYDGDGRTDIAVWRPSTGDWWVRRSTDGAYQATRWGAPTDVPVAGDYDGDGRTDIAVWRPSTGDWWVIRSTDGAYQATRWGAPTDVPVAGDYDGDGRTDIAVWRPSTGEWRVIRSTDGAYQVTQLGVPGDVPVGR